MKTRKGCWTCTARRIQCDGGLPSCQRCSRGGRKCQGYEMRLSWPRDDDKKRSITADLPDVIRLRPETNLFFINTTWRDIELYNRQSLQGEPLPTTGHSSDLWMQPQLRVSHMDLVHHFHTCAYLSLVTFGVDPSQLRDILMRMATAGDTVTKMAVLYALLAFSSLHLNGFHQQAIQLKLSALHSLSASAKQATLNLAEAAQHVAASMLLCSFEILIPSENSGELLWYIWGALNIVETTRLECQSHESDLGHLLDWLDYHDLMSPFSIHHWRHESQTLATPYIDYPGSQGSLQYSSLATYRPASPSPNPTYTIFNLLSDIYNRMTSPSDFSPHNNEHHNRLQALEHKISNLPIMAISTTFGADDALAVQVYQTATKIYFL